MALKKDEAIKLFESGVTDVEDIAVMLGTRPSYVATVLQAAGIGVPYFDLYTSSDVKMNAHSTFFKKKLGFKDQNTAEKSVRILQEYFDKFREAGDRAGQHHAMMLGLVFFNRARWTGKPLIAEIFGKWVQEKMTEVEPPLAE